MQTFLILIVFINVMKLSFDTKLHNVNLPHWQNTLNSFQTNYMRSTDILLFLFSLLIYYLNPSVDIVITFEITYATCWPFE